MRFRQIFSQTTSSTIVLRGVLALGLSVLLAAIYTAVSGENGFARFWFAIFGVPITWTLCTLAFHVFERESAGTDRAPDDRE